MSNTNVKLGTYKPTPEGKIINEIERGIFFDGTGNNKTNINARMNNTESFKKYGKDVNGSYGGEYSNVARFWSCCSDKYPIYIDGIGTIGNGEDNLIGKGFAHGPTGIPARIQQACKTIADSIGKGKKINTLTIDAYGYSRGAATARSFVNEISKTATKKQGFSRKPSRRSHTEQISSQYNWGLLGYHLKQNNITCQRLKIRFLGIYDTVSSYSPNLIPNFSNDIEELGLNNLNKVQRIIHFTASDEHRKLFALTRVPPSPKVFEFGFPGIHGDAGGGIPNGEEVMNLREGYFRDLEVFKDTLIKEGWYKGGERRITVSDDRRTETQTFGQLQILTYGILGSYLLRGTRNLKKSFSYIPLQFMGEIARNIKVPVNYSTMLKKYSIANDKLLVKYKSQFKAEGVGLKLVADAPKLTQEETFKLRNVYLHWSSRIMTKIDINDTSDVGMEPAKDRKRIYY